MSVNGRPVNTIAGSDSLMGSVPRIAQFVDVISLELSPFGQNIWIVGWRNASDVFGFGR